MHATHALFVERQIESFLHSSPNAYNTLGLCQKNRCRDLELQFLQKGHCWWCMDSVHDSGCHHPQVSPFSLQMLIGRCEQNTP